MAVAAGRSGAACPWNFRRVAAAKPGSFEKVTGMMQTRCMMSRAVLRPLGEAASVHLDPAPPSVVSHGEADTRKPSGALHLGSQDLIRVAGFASEAGFKVTGFKLADRYLTPLEEGEQSELSDALLAVLLSYGDRELISAMRDEFVGVFVIGVNLMSLETGFRISIRRSGYVDTSQLPVAEKLLDSAWRSLSLT